MKILKYLAILAVVLLVAFIAKGFITPNVTYGSEIVVNKPISEAWAVMQDEDKVNQWLEGMTKMEHIGGVKGEVGQVTKYTYVENGQESEIVETMKIIKPEEQVAMDFVMEGVMTMDYKMDLSFKDGKTHIKSHSITEGDGMIMRSLVSFMKGTMQAQEDANLARLKKVIEENTTVY